MSRRALAAVLLGALAWGCSGPGPRVSSVSVVASTQARSLEEAGVAAERQRAAVRDALRDAGFRVWSWPPGHRASLEVRGVAQVYSGASAGEVVEIVVELRLSPEGARYPAAAERGVGTARLEGEPAEALRLALAAAARDAARGAAVALTAEQRPIEALVTDLRSRDGRRRDQALRVLGDRREAAAVPALIELLRGPDSAVAEQAAGALARIGDPRAVGPIIDFSLRLEGGRHTARYARIIGDLGGSEGRGYLLTLESGHVDPAVRAAAREALGDLDAREAERVRLAEKARAESRRPGSGSMAR